MANQELIDPIALTEFLTSITLYSIAKMLLVFFLILYFIISIVVIKQINLMTRTINSDMNKFLYIIAYVHLAIVGACLVFSIFVL